ncbi:MAG: DUF6527 family protein [Pseudomonadota bacterium]
MIKFIVNKFNSFAAWFFDKEKLYESEYVPDIPKKLELYKVYILGGKKTPFLSVLRCPCGCGESLHMNLLTSRDPCWDLFVEPNGSVTFKPSLWKKTGCCSHFHLTNGEVKWVQ